MFTSCIKFEQQSDFFLLNSTDISIFFNNNDNNDNNNNSNNNNSNQNNSNNNINNNNFLNNYLYLFTHSSVRKL